jgi:predicted RNA binding protein YcfA (HicA-like mRNA interferase family)
MPKLKTLSGDDVVKILESFGFLIAAQRGSHVKLRRITDSGTKQTLTIPNHKELDKGTLRAIYLQVSKYVPELILREHFYSE